MENSNPKQDLKWWSEKYGADMEMKWPSLQDDNIDTSSQKSKEESPKPIRKQAETNLVQDTISTTRSEVIVKEIVVRGIVVGGIACGEIIYREIVLMQH